METRRQSRVRFAVVGLGHIAQAAVLPAFANARESCELTALVSDDARKAQQLADLYGVAHVVDYDGFDAFVAGGGVDAVYLALPNSLHCDYAVRAAEAGVHVLCEKPMAVTEDECRRMVAAAERYNVTLMIAYRLHFEAANMSAVDLIQSGELGEPRLFNSTFSIPVKHGDIRVSSELGGGTLYDIGIYCINAARYLFRDEPIEVVAASFGGNDRKFAGVDEATSAILRFPGDRVACFVSSFGAAVNSWYEVAGDRGTLRVEPAFSYGDDVTHRLTVSGRTTVRTFAAGDQFAPLLIDMADCIASKREPVPNGREGMADVRIIEAIYRSAIERRAVQLAPDDRPDRPDLKQARWRPPVDSPPLVDVESATGEQ